MQTVGVILQNGHHVSARFMEKLTGIPKILVYSIFIGKCRIIKGLRLLLFHKLMDNHKDKRVQHSKETKVKL